MYIFVVLDRYFCYETLHCAPCMSKATNSWNILSAQCTFYFIFPSFLCQSVRLSALTVWPVRLNYFTFLNGIFLLQVFVGTKFCEQKTALVYFCSVSKLNSFHLLEMILIYLHCNSKDQIHFLIEATLYYRWVAVVVHNDIYREFRKSLCT